MKKLVDFRSMKKTLRLPIDIHQYAFGKAGADLGCEKGPSTLKKALENANLASYCTFLPPLQATSTSDPLSDVIQLSHQLALSTQKSILNQHFFITLGGDHTSAIGSWSGAAQCVENLGLIWFDAHMDSHTPDTSLTQNIHGMPLAVLLGFGNKQLTSILSPKNKLKPENVVLIGVRSYESGEADLLKKLGVKIFYMEDIHEIGLPKVIQKSIEIVTKNTDGFGISIDLDGFDPFDAPGVSCPVADGIRKKDFLNVFEIIVKHPKLMGAEIVEFNPSLDSKLKTENLSLAICEKLFFR